jgi:hypothetical protein
MTTADQVKMFGMTEDSIRTQYMDSITAKFSGLEMVVAGILSDCQELTAMGRSEQVRQQLNVAKFILFEMIDKKETA